jgi:hypothetical protein
MYLEFIYPVLDYFKVLKKKNFFFEWAFPLFVSIVFVCFVEHKLFIEFKKHSIDIVGILLGFSIAIITILVTGGGTSIEEIKAFDTGIKINQTKISLYRLLLINYTYIIIIEVLIIVCSLLLPFALQICGVFNLEHTNTLIFFNGVYFFFVVHIFLVCIRNITDFYLVFTKEP